MIRPMTRVLLLLPTATYRAADFIDAARELGVEVVVASEERPILADTMGDRAVVVTLDDPSAGAAAIEELDARHGIDAVVAVDDQGVLVAAHAGEVLGFPHNPPDAAARTRDKAAMRLALEAGEVPQPRFAIFEDPDDVPSIGFPCVVKPSRLSASRGVIRANDADEARAAARRASDIAAGGTLLVEEYVPGDELALEGLLRDGELEVLAMFDKPDALEGPYFEETIYVTPARFDDATARDIERVVTDAATALGLREGPIHAEVRVHDHRVWVLEVAARSIGGLCARALRFGAGISLEEVILRHALGRDLGDLARESTASGVMMLPIPRAGRLSAVNGQDDARAVPGIVGLEITIPIGREVQPLPDGDRYLGFLFARADTPDEVESALRAAHAALDVAIT
ncbi:MAG: ATP-grasp domain-containing protein [Actinobacteria bacterium]|nr:ATP-grasp domain-containing protein [Actinomycetota bacterium]